MRSSTSLKLLWLTPCVLWAMLYCKTALAIEAGSCAVALGQATVQRGDELAGDLEILSWNIQKASNAGWAEDLARFSEDIDLAFIQEASVQARIPQVLAPGLHANFAQGYTTAQRETGVMTLSTSAPSGHCQLTSWEPWLGTPKATGITEYPLRDRDDRLLAINLHAINFDLGLERFHAQFDTLRDLLSRHQGPIILAGDLNTWSAERQALVDGFMREYGMGSIRFEPDLRTRAFGRALDHIYVRGLRADDARVIPVSSSDHNALRVKLGIL